MDVEVIKDLIQAFKEAELTDLSLKCEAFELKLGKEMKIDQDKLGELAMLQQSLNQAAPIKQVEAASEVKKVEVSQSPAEEKGLKTIKAPIVGTFYRAGSPSGKPFVEVGSFVHKGDVICVIEAMKLMNEVEAEEEGEVVEILVENEEMVEYNQPLIVLR